MKKLVLVIAVMAMAAGGAFAFDLPEFRLSAGAGGYFNLNGAGGIESSFAGVSGSMQIDHSSFGGFAFFDATYVEASVGIFHSESTMDTKGTIAGLINGESSTNLVFGGLDISLMGKFPFVLGEKLSVFPLVGVNLQFMLSAQDEDGNDLEYDAADFGALWFKFGGGLDFAFTKNIFLRAAAVYGIRLENTWESDMVSNLDKIPGVDAKSLLGQGLEVKLAVGYKF